MATIFTKIINGEIPANKVAETDSYLAFLDINPLAPGHTLVIPKKEIDYIFDIEDQDFIGLWLFAKEVSKAIEKAVPCKRVGVAVIGLEVPHTHIHLIPINNVSDINFEREKLKPGPEELRETANRISKAFLNNDI